MIPVNADPTWKTGAKWKNWCGMEDWWKKGSARASRSVNARLGYLGQRIAPG